MNDKLREEIYKVLDNESYIPQGAVERLTRYFLSLPAMKELLEKAAERDLIMERAVVDEECPECNGKGHVKKLDTTQEPPDEYTIDCPFCDGDMIVTRPATASEVREFIEIASKGQWIFTLTNGGVLRLEDKK